METRCAAFAAFSAAANELSDVELEKKRAKRVDTRSMVYNGHREISIYSRGWPLPPQKSLVLACLRSASKISLRESKNSSRNSPATTRRRRPRAPSAPSASAMPRPREDVVNDLWQCRTRGGFDDVGDDGHLAMLDVRALERSLADWLSSRRCGRKWQEAWSPEKGTAVAGDSELRQFV